jgi:hypothetical protein
MLFPNFCVPSVDLESVEVIERSRMSLSHLGWRSAFAGEFHGRFIMRACRNFLPGVAFDDYMKKSWTYALAVAGAAVGCFSAFAQVPQTPDPSYAPPVQAEPRVGVRVDLDWTPPAMAVLKSEATSKSSFSLDRNTLALAAGLIPNEDESTRQAVAKLDGVSVHMLRFGVEGVRDEAAVNEMRAAYHLRGWKHLVTNNSAFVPSSNPKSPLHNGTTDLWLVMDGANVRGGVALIESPRSLTLVTLAGNISPVDLLHLQGKFGIPRMDGEQFKAAN